MYSIYVSFLFLYTPKCKEVDPVLGDVYFYVVLLFKFHWGLWCLHSTLGKKCTVKEKANNWLQKNFKSAKQCRILAERDKTVKCYFPLKIF